MTNQIFAIKCDNGDIGHLYVRAYHSDFKKKTSSQGSHYSIEKLDDITGLLNQNDINLH